MTLLHVIKGTNLFCCWWMSVPYRCLFILGINILIIEISKNRLIDRKYFIIQPFYFYSLEKWWKNKQYKRWAKPLITFITVVHLYFLYKYYCHNYLYLWWWYHNTCNYTCFPCIVIQTNSIQTKKRKEMKINKRNYICVAWTICNSKFSSITKWMNPTANQPSLCFLFCRCYIHLYFC